MKIIGLFFLLSTAIFFTGCKTNSITGRSQLDLVSESQVQAIALTEYKDFLSKNPVVASSDQNQEMVRRIGKKIATAITKYYNDHGAGDQLAGYTWEFNLVESKEVNAWCMPGGKVVVYTGLLPITQNETALAIVLGHEITHAVAGHGRERMSQQLLAEGIQYAGDVALGGNPKTVSIFNEGLWTSCTDRCLASLFQETGNGSRSLWAHICRNGGLQPGRSRSFLDADGYHWEEDKNLRSS